MIIRRMMKKIEKLRDQRDPRNLKSYMVRVPLEIK